MIRDVHSDPDLDFAHPGSPIPDPGVKKAPDLGSATLIVGPNWMGFFFIGSVDSESRSRKVKVELKKKA